LASSWILIRSPQSAASGSVLRPGGMQQPESARLRLAGLLPPWTPSLHLPLDLFP
jgi:hypothetical protein